MPCASASYPADKASPQAHRLDDYLHGHCDGLFPAAVTLVGDHASRRLDDRRGLLDNARFVWSTSGVAPGSYRVNVWVRQNGSGAAYESFSNAVYGLT